MYETPAPDLGGIAATLAGMADVDFASLLPAALTPEVEAWCGALSALQAVGARLLAPWDAHMGWVDDGAANGSAWLRAHGDLDDGNRHLKVARRLRDWAPVTAAALAAGSLSYGKAQIMVLALTSEIAAQFGDCEQILVDAARQVTVKQTKTLMARWRSITEDVIDTANDADPAERLGAARNLKIWESFGGTVALEGTLSPEVGQAFIAEIARREQRMFRQDITEARAAVADACGCGDDGHYDGQFDPDDAGGLTLARTPGQRRADALAEIILVAMHDNHSDGRVGAPATTIVVTVTATELARATRALHLPGSPDQQPRTDPRFGDRYARLADDATLARYQDLDRPVDDHTLAMLACDCTIVRMVLDASGVPLEMGRQHRHATPTQRRALIQRDGGCAFPGCGRPPKWCDAHHIVPWETNGNTDLDNMVLLCRHHHTQMHKRTPWTVRIDPQTRRPVFTRPDGIPARQPGLQTRRPPDPPPDQHTRAA